MLNFENEDSMGLRRICKEFVGAESKKFGGAQAWLL